MDEDVLASAIAASTAVITFWENVVVVGGELFDLDQSSGGQTEEEEHQVKRPRNVHPRQLCEDSLFGQMLKAPEALLAPQTAEAKLFRRRFRLALLSLSGAGEVCEKWRMIRGSGDGRRGSQDHPRRV